MVRFNGRTLCAPTKGERIAASDAPPRNDGGSKFHNMKSGGYDSKREHRRAQELELMEKAGVIRDLRRQVRYELIPAIYTDGFGRLVPSPVMQSGSDRAPLGPRIPGEKIPERDRRRKSMYCLERPCAYVADFVYILTETGETVVEDAKGCRTKDYLIKRKLMLWRYGIDVKEV